MSLNSPDLLACQTPSSNPPIPPSFLSGYMDLVSIGGASTPPTWFLGDPPMVGVPLLGLQWPPVVSATAPSKTSEASSQSPVSLHVRSRSSLGRSSALFGYFWDALGDFWSTFGHF